MESTAVNVYKSLLQVRERKKQFKSQRHRKPMCLEHDAGGMEISDTHSRQSTFRHKVQGSAHI